MKSRTLFLALLVFCSVTANAHTGHAPTNSLPSGLLHPLQGLDHLLAMIAVGLWASQLGGRSRWIVPLAFVATMFLGGLLGTRGLVVPMVEQGVALSVMLLGLVIAFALRGGVWVSATTVAVFALFHGAAHGAEIPEAGAFLPYGLGFVFTTALLHGVGILLGEGLAVAVRREAIRAVGGGIAVAGLFLLVGVI
jgi:urease accessory protein